MLFCSCTTTAGTYFSVSKDRSSNLWSTAPQSEDKVSVVVVDYLVATSQRPGMNNVSLYRPVLTRLNAKWVHY